MSLKLENVTETPSVYQEKGVFCYGTDAVLLSAYASAALSKTKKLHGMELCSGTGFMALSMLDRWENMTFSALEINSRACEISEMSAEVSGLSHRFSVICGDVKNTRSLFSSERFDFIICNPPYMTASSGKMCNDDYITIARHEILCGLSDIFSAAYYLLGTGGNIYIVYRPDRLSTLFSAAKENHFEIKRMTFVHSRAGSAPSLVLCEAKKQAKEGLLLSEPFVIYDSDGNYTDMMNTVCKKGEMRFGK